MLVASLLLLVPGALIWRIYLNDDQRLYYLGVTLSLSGVALGLLTTWLAGRATNVGHDT